MRFLGRRDRSPGRASLVASSIPGISGVLAMAIAPLVCLVAHWSLAGRAGAENSLFARRECWVVRA
jgi:hypothetical protein